MHDTHSSLKAVSSEKGLGASDTFGVLYGATEKTEQLIHQLKSAIPRQVQRGTCKHHRAAWKRLPFQAEVETSRRFRALCKPLKRRSNRWDSETTATISPWSGTPTTLSTTTRRSGCSPPLSWIDTAKHLATSLCHYRHNMRTYPIRPSNILPKTRVRATERS